MKTVFFTILTLMSISKSQFAFGFEDILLKLKEFEKLKSAAEVVLYAAYSIEENDSIGVNLVVGYVEISLVGVRRHEDLSESILNKCKFLLSTMKMPESSLKSSKLKQFCSSIREEFGTPDNIARVRSVREGVEISNNLDHNRTSADDSVDSSGDMSIETAEGDDDRQVLLPSNSSNQGQWFLGQWLRKRNIHKFN